ncbi:MAG TPA: sigma-54 dependent transcriptional regulator [Alphaproteobacteria bacterium]|nr:sigma-54 dependent transcriptional regulator [Alphaproteobacteria bacterium]
MTTPDRPRILLVEDTASLARVYVEYLRKEPYETVHVETGAAGLAEIERQMPEAVLLDLALPDMNGIEILKRVHSQALPVAVIVITAHGSITTAVEAMREGAYDFLVKPFSADRLLITLRNALERQRLARMVETLKEDFGRDEYMGFIGSSLPMQGVYRIIDSAAASKATIFITGESGTGKEVCAQAIHQRSPRARQPFVALNCAAIPHDLIESEIFGHVKGAFTGAVAEREGAAARAKGGTFFLDEICEMNLDLQSKLLRFVQTGSFVKVGGRVTEKADVRFICASNKDPLKEVEAGRFREDLYYRLHVIPVHLPPLRERDDDVLALARHFLTLFAKEEGKRFTGFAPEVEAVLRSYPWPGNVRQLQNVLRNVVVLKDAETVTLDMLPPPLDHVEASSAALPAARGREEAVARQATAPGQATADGIRPLWQIEKDAIEDAIRLCQGNIPKAATHLGISASTIYRKRMSWQTGGEG